MTFSATEAEIRVGASIGIILPDEAPKDAKPREAYARDLQRIRDYVGRQNRPAHEPPVTAEEIASKLT